MVELAKFSNTKWHQTATYVSAVSENKMQVKISRSESEQIWEPLEAHNLTVTAQQRPV